MHDILIANDVPYNVRIQNSQKQKTKTNGIRISSYLSLNQGTVVYRNWKSDWLQEISIIIFWDFRILACAIIAACFPHYIIHIIKCRARENVISTTILSLAAPEVVKMTICANKTWMRISQTDNISLSYGILAICLLCLAVKNDNKFSFIFRLFICVSRVRI